MRPALAHAAFFVPHCRFGNFHQRLWETPRPNSDEVNAAARAFIKEMDADMNGTRLAPVLEDIESVA